jgi:hypothetical protein
VAAPPLAWRIKCRLSEIVQESDAVSLDESSSRSVVKLDSLWSAPGGDQLSGISAESDAVFKAASSRNDNRLASAAQFHLLGRTCFRPTGENAANYAARNVHHSRRVRSRTEQKGEANAGAHVQ